MRFSTSRDASLFRRVPRFGIAFPIRGPAGAAGSKQRRQIGEASRLPESHPGGTSSRPPPLFASPSLYKCQGGLSPLHTAIVQTHSLWRCFSVSVHGMNCWWWKKKTLLQSVPQARELVNNAAEGLGERETGQRIVWRRHLEKVSSIFFSHHAVNWNKWGRVWGSTVPSLLSKMEPCKWWNAMTITSVAEKYSIRLAGGVHTWSSSGRYTAENRRSMDSQRVEYATQSSWGPSRTNSAV